MPYRIIVSGRVKHFISAFGEHVIAKEVEEALRLSVVGTKARINEFTVAPQITPEQNELPYHEWLIEFEQEPESMSDFARKIDENMQQQNSYYFEFVAGKVLQSLKINTYCKRWF